MRLVIDALSPARSGPYQGAVGPDCWPGGKESHFASSQMFLSCVLVAAIRFVQNRMQLFFNKKKNGFAKVKWVKSHTNMLRDQGGEKLDSFSW